ncbi:MAG: hypothetical protein ACN4GF_00105 [Lentimonas sp.]
MLHTDVKRGPVALSSAELDSFNVDLVDAYDLNGVIPPTPGTDGRCAPPGDVLNFVLSDRSVVETPIGSADTAWGMIMDDVGIDVQSLSSGGLNRRLQVKEACENGNLTFGRFSGQVEAGVTFNRIDLDWDRNASIVANNVVLSSESYGDHEVDI